MRKLIRPSQEELEKIKQLYAKEHTSDVKKRRNPPSQTGKEVHFLSDYVQNQTPVIIKLHNNREISGTIEYYDMNFIRVTLSHAPNEFIYKKDILYIQDAAKKH